MKRLTSAIFLTALICSVTALAADLKIGVLDLQKVFQNYEKTKIMEMKLNQQLEVFKEYAVKRSEELQKLNEEFKQTRDASQNIALSSAERESKRLLAIDLYRLCQVKERELTAYNREKNAQVKEQYEKMRTEILGEIQRYVRSIAAMEGYSLILDKSTLPGTGVGIVLYNQPSMDLTDKVLTGLNRGFKINAKNPAEAKAPEKKEEPKNDKK